LLVPLGDKTIGEENMFRLRHLLSLAALAAALACGAPAPAQTIIDEWSSVKVPPPPELKPVTLDPKTTALLVMDLFKQICNMERRPRCVASIPRIEKLLAEARAKGVTIVYTLVPSLGPNVPGPVIGDTLPAIAPKGNEPVIVSFVDKFVLNEKDTGLANILKEKGVTSVIAVGTAAHGAVLYTSSAAALRGFNVIVPVDGMSTVGEDTYVEQYVAYNLTRAPIVSPKVTLTRTDMIGFSN
jgi:nicotinamidase-related amidase